MHAIVQSKATRWHRRNLLRSTFSASLPSACRLVWRHESQRSPSTDGDDALQHVYFSVVRIRTMFCHLSTWCLCFIYGVFFRICGVPINARFLAGRRAEFSLGAGGSNWCGGSNHDRFKHRHSAEQVQPRRVRESMNVNSMNWMKKWRGVIWVIFAIWIGAPQTLTLSGRHICLVTSDRTVCGSADDSSFF